MGAENVVEELWREQSLWSCAADRLKTRVARARLAALVITAIVAAMGTAASTLPSGSPVARISAALAALGAALIPLLRPAWSGNALRDWTGARSVSEALKGEICLWLARAGDYRDDVTAARLVHRTDRIRSDAADRSRHLVCLRPEPTELPPIHDARSYLQERARRQVDEYYQPRAEELARKLARFRRIEVGLALLAALIGTLAAATTTSLAPWIAATTTVGTAIAVHVASSRYDYQLIEYIRTATELRRLLRDAELVVSDDALDRLVTAAEAAISMENQGWMAKVAEDISDQQTPHPG